MKFPKEDIRGWCQYRLFRFLFRRISIYEQQYYAVLPRLYKEYFVPGYIIFEYFGKRWTYNKTNQKRYGKLDGSVPQYRNPISGRYTRLFYME